MRSSEPVRALSPLWNGSWATPGHLVIGGCGRSPGWPFPAGPGRLWRTNQSPVLLMNTVGSEATVFTDNTVDMAGPVDAGPSPWNWGTGLTRMTIEEAALLGHRGSPSRKRRTQRLSSDLCGRQCCQERVEQATDEIGALEHIAAGFWVLRATLSNNRGVDAGLAQGGCRYRGR